MSEPTKLAEEKKAKLDLPHDTMAEFLKFVEKVGGIEHAMRIMDDLDRTPPKPEAD